MMLYTCLCVCTLLSPLITSAADTDADFELTNSFAVQIHGDRDEAQRTAHKHGFYLESDIAVLGLYHFVHDSVAVRSKRAAHDVIEKLQNDPSVKLVKQQKVLIREKREIVHDKQYGFPIRNIEDKSVYQRYDLDRLVEKDDIAGAGCPTYDDPYSNDEWYLCNAGQTGGKPGVDLNVVTAWAAGYNGSGVVVCILDDGIDHTHEDLKNNYDEKASADLNDRHDNDPMPNVKDPENSHGTRCAGEVAAEANNDVCGIGVAYGAGIGGIRMLDGTVTDYLEAQALLYQCNHTSIFSASWGPRDNAKTMEGPMEHARAAFKEGVKHCRHGLGAIYVWATGNGGLTEDDCNADGYVSSIETLSVGSINDQGARPYFMEVCPSTMVVVPTGGAEKLSDLTMEMKPKIKVVTTDIKGGCTLEFQGTSSAAPLAAGCIALVLQANNKLTWRDIQYLVVNSAKIPKDDNSWVVNGAKYHVSHSFGFGVMDCGRMVQLAQTWTNVPEQHVCTVGKQSVSKHIGSSMTITMTIDSDGCMHNNSQIIKRLEHVQLYINLSHTRRGDVRIFLASPMNTVSEMLSPRPPDDSTDGIDFTFMTVHNWGESPVGTWTLEITDWPQESGSVNTGTLHEWELILYGHGGDGQGTSLRSLGDPDRKAYAPDKSAVKLIMEHETEISRAVQITHAGDVLKLVLPQQEHKIDVQRKDEITIPYADLERILTLVNELKQGNPDVNGGVDNDEYGNSRHDKKSKIEKSKNPPTKIRPQSMMRKFVGEHRELLDSVVEKIHRTLDSEKSKRKKHKYVTLKSVEDKLDLLRDKQRSRIGADVRGVDEDGLIGAWLRVKQLLDEGS